jgi:hypothetical protein
VVVPPAAGFPSSGRSCASSPRQVESAGPAMPSSRPTCPARKASIHGPNGRICSVSYERPNSTRAPRRAGMGARCRDEPRPPFGNAINHRSGSARAWCPSARAPGRRWSSVRLVTLDAKEPLTLDAAITVPATGLRPQAHVRRGSRTARVTPQKDGRFNLNPA